MNNITNVGPLFAKKFNTDMLEIRSTLMFFPIINVACALKKEIAACINSCCCSNENGAFDETAAALSGDMHRCSRAFTPTQN